MTLPNTDPNGSTEDTGYQDQREPRPNAGYSKSIWCLAIAAAFLLIIVGWSILQPAGSDPAPAGSTGNGLVRTPAQTGSTR